MSLALFDLDNTLLAGDSAQAFSEFLTAQDEIPTPHNFLQRNQAFMDDYEAGALDFNAYMSYTLAPLVGLPPTQLQTLIRAYVDTHINAMIPARALALLDEHRRAGDEIAIVSATGAHLVAPIAERLGAPHVLAVDIEIRDGVITGSLIGTPTFREGKVTRVQAWAAQHGWDYQDAAFYSDSHNDLPLLEAVRRPVAVDPDPVLRRIAVERGWEILSLRDEKA
ncbi:Phosphoserine phosphatase [Hahella chejuensis KCTC 2396]|uniref:Histidinol-phosphatase n=1 Tax=Hahella chejuensis (strain KCTC 2396) TaxID=349521 RepID=Q2SHM7_HAHCH|nr:HAD family hydrolase [Hahella chejuensis]ABC29847.1 Phosphoserine phosphatase [Hahella chejuensis KCTC 2396]